MKVIARGPNFIAHGPDFCDVEVKDRDGKVWRFDFDKWAGPLWLKKDGSQRKCQYPCKKAWDAFDKWNRKHNK